MASQGAITLKTAKAVQTIQTASTALAKKFNLNIEPLPNISRADADFGRAVQLQHLGETLRQIAVVTKAAKESDFGDASPEAGEAVTPEAEMVQPMERRK